MLKAHRFFRLSVQHTLESQQTLLLSSSPKRRISQTPCHAIVLRSRHTSASDIHSVKGELLTFVSSCPLITATVSHLPIKTLVFLLRHNKWHQGRDQDTLVITGFSHSTVLRNFVKSLFLFLFLFQFERARGRESTLVEDRGRGRETERISSRLHTPRRAQGGT